MEWSGIDKEIVRDMIVNPNKYKSEEYFETQIENRYPFLTTFKTNKETWKNFYLIMMSCIFKLEEEYQIPYIPSPTFDPNKFLFRLTGLKPNMAYDAAIIYAQEIGNKNLIDYLNYKKWGFGCSYTDDKCSKKDGYKKIDAQCMVKNEECYKRERDQNLFIFDWDDTLYPTTGTRISQLPPEKYEELDDKIFDLFNILLPLGDIVIVTNGSVRHINSTSENLPRVLSMILNETVQILSARDIFSYETETSPNKGNIWKKKLFEIEFDKYIGDTEGVKKIVSFGDGEAELEAAESLKTYKPVQGQKRIVNPVVFIKNPATPELLIELDKVKELIPEILNNKDGETYKLVNHMVFPW